MVQKCHEWWDLHNNIFIDKNVLSQMPVHIGIVVGRWLVCAVSWQASMGYDMDSDR